jgi:UDP-N-acetylmuramoylalanine--D-glutamate ligase
MGKKKKVLIMGLGLHGGGAGAANYFSARGDEVTVTDLKTEKELKLGIDLIRDKTRVRFVLGRHDYRDFETSDLIIQNPGVPPHSPYIARARERGIPIETDISVFLDLIGNKTKAVVGVTGTKGKSTTASLIHAILDRRGHALLAGNITVSVFDILDQVVSASAIVLELSSFQLGGLRHRNYSPPAAVMTNLLDDHLNYYASREAYFEDKKVIHRFQHAGNILVLNRDNQVYGLTEENEGVRRISFGIDGNFSGEGSYVHRGMINYRGCDENLKVLDLKHIQIPGRHNLYNVLAASAVAVAMGVETDKITEGIRGFHGLPHRLERLGECGGIQYINDSAATTPDAAVQGISSVQGALTLIAGGADKALSLRELAGAINRRAGLLVLLDGSGTRRLLDEGIEIPHRVFDNLGDAVLYAHDNSRAPATILLSPGFASFGMFKNEFDRGNQFRDIVLERYGVGDTGTQH